MPTADVDAAAIIEVLARHEVEFVVIGGFAVELHDVAVPPTQDIDITPATSPDNLDRLASALQELDARLRLPDDPSGLPVPGGITAELLGHMSALTLITDKGALDLSFAPSGTDGYADLARGVTRIEYQGRTVPVADLADVLRSKEAAGREKDFRMIPAIRAHLRRRGSRG